MQPASAVFVSPLSYTSFKNANYITERLGCMQAANQAAAVSRLPGVNKQRACWSVFIIRKHKSCVQIKRVCCFFSVVLMEVGDGEVKKTRNGIATLGFG